jgi:SOS regulatory protein LexA
MGLTKKQHEVLEYIKNYTKKKGYAPTQREIKDHFELKSYGSVQRYLKYLKEAGLLTNDWNAKRGITLVSESSSSGNSHEMEIPLLGDVAAGNPIEALENPTEHITVPISMIKKSGKHFALKIKGDSMIEDGILDGDVVIIQSAQTASTGQTVVAVIEGEATLKKYFKKKGHLELHPANHTMQPIVVEPDQQVSIVGHLVGLMRSYL